MIWNLGSPKETAGAAEWHSRLTERVIGHTQRPQLAKFDSKSKIQASLTNRDNSQSILFDSELGLDQRNEPSPHGEPNTRTDRSTFWLLWF